MIAVSQPPITAARTVIFTGDTCTGTSLAKDESCALSISLKPTTLGAKSTVLTVTGTNLPPAVRALTGSSLTGDAWLTPAALDFDRVSVGTTSAPQAVTARNMGGSSSGTLVVTGAGNYALFPLSDNTCVGTLAPGAGCSFQVRFAPTQVKSESASYTLSDGMTKMTVNLAGIGVP